MNKRDSLRRLMLIVYVGYLVITIWHGTNTDSDPDWINDRVLVASGVAAALWALLGS